MAARARDAAPTAGAGARSRGAARPARGAAGRVGASVSVYGCMGVWVSVGGGACVLLTRHERKTSELPPGSRGSDLVGMEGDVMIAAPPASARLAPDQRRRLAREFPAGVLRVDEP